MSKCLDSVLSQTHAGIEAVVVNDCSTRAHPS
ncbi:MAG: glycosyltransferase [Candidatus Dadabacteria bacterium]|nr:glycosyltransferase [Candidatus Dadabacteria bacterium]